MADIGALQLNNADIGPVQSEGVEFDTITNQINLRITGSASGVVTSNEDDSFGLEIDVLLNSSDYNPQLIGRFDVIQDSVTIEVYDVIGGNNVIVILNSDECYEIGDTGRWGWSTSNLPPLNGVINQYVYKMIGNNSEVFVGTFIIKNSPKINDKIPRNNNHIRRV